MKKLISLAVVLALVAMVVLPVAVGADTYLPPQTYAKVPFAILASGLQLVATLWPALESGLSLSGLDWIGWVVGNLSGWTYGPLSWSVDMLAWGMNLGADVLTAVSAAVPSLPTWVPGLFTTVACSLLTCWSDSNCTGTFAPCA